MSLSSAPRSVQRLLTPHSDDDAEGPAGQYLDNYIYTEQAEKVRAAKGAIVRIRLTDAQLRRVKRIYKTVTARTISLGSLHLDHKGGIWVKPSTDGRSIVVLLPPKNKR